MNLERWGWYSIGVNVLLMLVHGVIATVSGSLAMTAELVHNNVEISKIAVN
jgi:divalent metal cation (Fe/Co/Zn/Cd) transporter